MPNPLDSQDSPLSSPVAQWLVALRALVPADNEFLTLKAGVDAAAIKRHAQLDDETRIPDALIAFYKLLDVSYHPVTSAVLFDPTQSGYGYSLIAFKDIQDEWQGIQDLCDDAPLEADMLTGFAPEVNASDYANPQWIPFAHDYSGNYLLFDADPSPLGQFGQILELSNEDWTRTVVAPSLGDLLSNATQAIQNGDVAAFDCVLGKR